MSVHPIQREPDLPFVHDARTVFAHLRRQGVPASEALRLVKRRFPVVKNTEAAESHPSEEVACLRAQKHAADRRIASLEQDLARARERIAGLERDLAAASAQTGSALFRQVGLDAGCPDFVIVAARKAFRRHHHPDHRPSCEKAEAEAEFKRFEGLFAQLFALRGLR